MATYGFHSSHEQIHPAALLKAVVRAEQAGFAAAMSSDHFSPWSARQGHSGFAWSWLGAALQATGLRFGVVNAPGQRYHPAIVAQAIGTLAAMFPGRFWAALGTGEASNEHITGEGWPRKPVRTARLRECVDVIRALLAGEEVSHDGLVTVDRARLWTRPETPPELVGAAVSVETARWCAEWADGLITVNAPIETLRRMIGAYRDAGGRGGWRSRFTSAGPRTTRRPWPSPTTSGGATSSARPSAGTSTRPSSSTWCPRTCRRPGSPRWSTSPRTRGGTPPG
nr:hypothetical protein GCM10020093_053900 [Planobispora longispora]